DILNTMPSSPIVLALIAKVHAYQGQDEAASLEYASALQELPYLSYTWANLGSVELALARSGSARLDLQRALDLDASNRIAATSWHLWHYRVATWNWLRGFIFRHSS